MPSDPMRVCELLVGLPDVTVLAVDDVVGQPLEIRIETRTPRPSCQSCGNTATFYRPASGGVGGSAGVWSANSVVLAEVSAAVPFGGVPGPVLDRARPAIGWPRLAMTDRAGRWVTAQVGRSGRTINEVAVELGTDWHTINDTVHAFGVPLIDHPDRIGTVQSPCEWLAKQG